MKIITISREFGSGGREIGKRLSDVLGFDYYDKEIITQIAQNKKMDENYIENMLENQGWRTIPLNFRTSFSGLSMQSLQVEMLLEQRNVIEEIAKAGKNCVIVGRSADEILEDCNPLNIFICADLESKIKRSVERAPEDENLSEKEIKRKMRQVDKDRARTRDIISGSPWGNRGTYHLTVNTSSWHIKELTNAIADFAESFFNRTKV